MCELRGWINRIDREEISEVMLSVLQWYRALFPEWDIQLISIHKEHGREEQIDECIKVLEKLKTSSE